MQSQEIYQLQKQAKQIPMLKSGERFNMQYESGMIEECTVSNSYPDCHIKGTDK